MEICDGDEKSDDDLQIADCSDSGKLQKMLGGSGEMVAQMLINNRTVTG